MTARAVAGVLRAVCSVGCGGQENFESGEFGCPERERLRVIFEAAIRAGDPGWTVQSVEQSEQTLRVLLIGLAGLRLRWQVIHAQENVVGRAGVAADFVLLKAQADRVLRDDLRDVLHDLFVSRAAYVEQIL